MKAKINFTGTVVGDHPNVLKFLGAVTGDEASTKNNNYYYQTIKAFGIS